MAKHDFGLLPTAPAQHEHYDYTPEKYGCIQVPDELIEPLMEKLTQLRCFWHTIDRPEKNLAYCGITLIPPSSADEFLAALDGVPGAGELSALLQKAKAEGRFVIHYGL